MKFYKSIKKIVLCSIILAATLIGITVNAKTPDSFVLNKGRQINGDYNGGHDIVPGDGFIPIYFPIKYTENNYLVFCSGDRSADATPGSTFTKTNFVRSNDGAAVAGVIKLGVGENATTDKSDEDIFLTQLAIWKVLAPNAGNAFPATENAILNNEVQKNKYNKLIAAGEDARSRYDDIKNFNITLNTDKLEFTLNDNVYESQVIKVSGKEIKAIETSVDIGEVVKKDGGYVIRIAKDILSIGKNTVTLKIDAVSNTIEIAQNYTNGNEDQQTTTTTIFEHYNNTTSKTIKGIINIVKISKVDATNEEELPGATLIIKDANGKEVAQWVSTNEPNYISLDPGTYTLTEFQAPNGYITSTETITFTVNEEGKVDSPVVMKNYPLGEVFISKQDITTKKELPNAHLILKDANGNQIEKWISGDQPHPISGLEPGKYYLTELLAPDGYITSTETIEFEVDEKGNVKEMVVMYNERIPDVSTPDTASFKTIATSIVGIITIALGGVTIYRVYKKNEA